ncbi:hypothetical protein V6N12_005596 [Hibiscus sabdariffa]|uniref:Protein kinase domain-containing protein n=1 Tax=Hibiscus sabdariffa TaxID=183260 RepID=A0ABR2APC3_9ROSI
MRCFSCFYPSTKSNPNSPTKAALLQEPSPGNVTFRIKDDDASNPKATEPEPPKISDASKDNHSSSSNNTTNNKIEAQTFSFRELATATKNFRRECLIGEGGFGRVYKGKLEKTGQVKTITFCLHCLMGLCVLSVMLGFALALGLPPFLDIRPHRKPLDWYTRMKIALGASTGLEYLHDKASSPVIYRDLKSSNILLDEEYNARLSDFGLAKLGPVGDNTHVSSRIMGTYGYCAPEYLRTGRLTVKSDVYSFGVVLLELITGRRVIDTTRPNKEQNLIAWAEPMFRDRSCFLRLADPLLKGDYPQKGFRQAIAVAAMCLQEEATVRPLMSDVVSALSFLGNCALVARTDASSSGP